MNWRRWHSLTLTLLYFKTTAMIVVRGSGKYFTSIPNVWTGSSEKCNKFPFQVQTATYNKLNFCLADVIYHRGDGGWGGRAEVITQSAVSFYPSPTTAQTQTRQEKPLGLNCNAPAIRLRAPPSSPLCIVFILVPSYRAVSSSSSLVSHACKSWECQKWFPVWTQLKKQTKKT